MDTNMSEYSNYMVSLKLKVIIFVEEYGNRVIVREFRVVHGGC